jgi:hypothetical protein
MRVLLLCCALGTLLGLVGCGHYQLGTDVAPRFESLHIAVVASDALLPQAQALFTTQLRDAFIKDGRVRLVNSEDGADAILRVTLDSYSRGVTVSRPDDTGLARRFDLALSARATLTDLRSRRDLFTGREITAKRGAFTDSGQIQAEYQTLPLLAADVADQAVKAALDTW